jgi:hypothetical protein
MCGQAVTQNFADFLPTGMKDVAMVMLKMSTEKWIRQNAK